MADRYWVGGTGTWDASTTTNWATTSGGAGGASAPTSADNAYFDGNSDSGAPFTVTISTGAVCADVIIGDASTVTVLDQAMTLAGSAAWGVYGSLFFPTTSLTITYSGSLTFDATSSGKTVTTNGASLLSSTVDFRGIGGEWTLGSDFLLAVSSELALSNGTFNSGSFDITVGRLRVISSATKTVNLGTSTITSTINNGSEGITFAGPNTTLSASSAKFVHTATNGQISFPGISGGATVDSASFTAAVTSASYRINNFTANTFFVNRPNSASMVVVTAFSDITVTGAVHFMSGYGATFDITDTAGVITAATVNFGGIGYNVGDVLNVTGGNGDAQLTVATLSGTAIATVTISTPGTGYTTATGVATTLATSALNPNRRLLIASDTAAARTITAAAVNITNTDFRAITGAGAATWSDSGRTRYWGDALGNSGITFSAGVNKYWNQAGGINWSANTAYASSSGGSPSASNFPLPQDTVIFDDAGSVGTVVYDQSSYITGSIDASARTSAMTFQFSSGLNMQGDFILSSSVTLTGTGSITFFGFGSNQTVNPAGKKFNLTTIGKASGTVTLAGNIDTSLGGGFNFQHSGGTLDMANYTVSCAQLRIVGTTAKTCLFGSSGKFLCSTFDIDGNNYSYTGSGLVECTGTGGTVSTGWTASNALSFNFTGSSTASFSGSAFAKNLTFTGFTGTFQGSAGGGVSTTVYGDVTFVSGMTVSLANQITFAASAGTQIFTTVGKTVDQNLAKGGAGTLQLADNLTMGSSRTFTLTTGTLALNDKTLSTGTFSSSNSNTRSIDFGAGGKLECVGSGTVFNATTGTNLTTTGTGVIDLTSASTKTFAGGGRTYPTLNQGGSGTLLITGANTFANITNTVQPTTITFPSGVTTSVQDFNVNGTPGNLVTLNASTPGSRAFLNKI